MVRWRATLMTKAFIIIGEAGMRKSGAVRALTGAYDRGLYPVETINNGVLDLFIQIRSLQEVEISPETFIDETREEGYNHILLTLRIENANDYIKEFIKSKWEIVSIISFVKDTLPVIRLNYHTIHNTDTMPANKIASIIRNLWNWI
jgi:hypothetical protein